MSQLDSSNLFSAKGVVAVVTGGGSGIGLMIAAALENNGAKVYIVGRRKEILEKAAEEHAKHGNLIPIVGDVTSRESLLNMAKIIEEQVGYITVLVNNAGMVGPLYKPLTPETSIKEFQERLLNMSSSDVQKTFDVNTTAAFFGTAVFLELLSKGNERGIPGVSSQVITVSSISGYIRDGRQTGVAYSISKAAAIHLGKLMANMFFNYDIRSNIIIPGLYPSEMSHGLGMMRKELFTKSYVPAERPGMPEDMAGLILYLTTRAGAYVNGNVSITDGGRLGLYSTTF